MKSLKIIFTFVVLSLQSYGQTNIQVIVKNHGNHKIDKVDIFDLSQTEFFEIPYSDTLNFTFNKKNIDNYYMRFYENAEIYQQHFWLDSGQIKIEAHFDASELVIDSVFNSPTYYDLLKFTRDFSELDKKNDTTAINKLLLELYSNNIDNPLSFIFASIYINSNQNSKPNLSKLKILTDKQGDKFNWFLLYKPVIERLNTILTVGALDIDEYFFIDRQNKNVKLPALSKKYYILDFWFLSCAPCVRDHKKIEKELKTLEEKNAEMISISTDSDKVNKWETYLTKNKYNWQNYLESETKKITQELKLHSFPTYIIIDQSGNILITLNSFSQVLTWLDKE